MFRDHNNSVAAGLLAMMLTMVVFSERASAEEYVWARFYGSNLPTGYATNGFGSYYVPKSMVANNKQQTDPIKKPADPNPVAKTDTEAKPTPVPPASESQASQPSSQPKKSLWKRLTLRK